MIDDDNNNRRHQSRLQGYLSNKELGLGRQIYESENYAVYNTIIEVVIIELLNDGIIVKQQKESSPDDPIDKYETTQKLDKICKDFMDGGLSF